MLRRLSRMLVVGVLLATATLPAFAGTDTDFGITVTTPNTYGSCSATGDTITVAGLTNLNATNPNPDIKYTLEGWVSVQFVLPGGGRQIVPNGYQTVVMATDGVIQVTYPPAYTWPLSDPVFNTAEIHVDLSLELVARNVNGIVQFLDTFGPGIDWDVFCAPPPPQGCTPGYWKNHLDAWGPTGFSPSQTVVSVFSAAVAFPTEANSTLLQGLSFQGGSTLEGAVQILLRAGIAAVLNSAYPGVRYPLPTNDVKSQVNSALASNSRSTMLNLATTLDADNNLGCPLN
jgi:hypothetical protein